MSGMMTKSSGKTKVKGFDKRYFLLTRSSLSYWKNESAYIKAPTAKMKGSIELSSIVSLVRTSTHPKLKKPLMAREPFEVHTDPSSAPPLPSSHDPDEGPPSPSPSADPSGDDRDGGAKRVYILVGESAEDSSRWYEAIRLAWLRHPRTMLRFGVVPPGLEPSNPLAPPPKPDPFVPRSLEAEVVRSHPGNPAGVAASCVARRSIVCALDGDEGMAHWSWDEISFLPVDGGQAGRCSSLVLGKEDPSMLYAGFASSEETSGLPSLRRFSLPSEDSGLLPFRDAVTPLSVREEGGPPVVVEWIQVSEAESLVVAYTSDQKLHFVSTRTNCVTTTVDLDVPLVGATMGAHGKLLFTVSAGTAEEGAISAYRCSPPFGELEAVLNGAHEPEVQFTPHSLIPISQGALLSVGSDSVLALWNTRDLALEAKMMHPGQRLIAAVWSRSSNSVFTLSESCVGVWSADSLLALGQVELVLPHADQGQVPLSLLAPADPGAVIVCTTTDIQIYDISTTALLITVATRPSLASPIVPRPSLRVLLSSGSLFWFGPSDPHILELPNMEKRIESARESHVSLSSSLARWNEAIVEHQVMSTTFDYESAEHAKLVEAFMVHMTRAVA